MEVHRPLTLNRLLKIVAFVLFLIAFAVTEGWAGGHGTVLQWVTAGLSVFALAEAV